jgi:hypothetical protein
MNCRRFLVGASLDRGRRVAGEGEGVLRNKPQRTLGSDEADSERMTAAPGDLVQMRHGRLWKEGNFGLE